MSGKTRLELCDACRWDGGQHFDADEDGNVTVTRPHHEAARLADAAEKERTDALAATAEANHQAYEQALQIIRDAALSMPELSGNDVRHRMSIAQIPGPVVGAAFAHLAREGVHIEHTGRYVKSDDKGTHQHRIGLYRSLTYRADERSRAVAS